MKATHYIVFASCAVVAALAGAAGATSQTAERQVNVLFMSDTHAALEAHPEVFFDKDDKPTFRTAGGYALLAGAIEAERASGPSMLVNVGDTIHGSAVAEWTQGEAIVPVVNALGIDASCRETGSTPMDPRRSGSGCPS